MKTESESLFEQFCNLRKIRCERISPCNQKIPDYDIFINRRKIVVEIKQMNANPKETQKINELNASGATTIKTEPGKRVRGRITDSQGKFRERMRNKHPSILVLYDNVNYHKLTEPFDIYAGMYGQPYFPVEYSTDSMQIGNMKVGPNKKMTVSSNTSISAIGVLKKNTKGEPVLIIYHNNFTRIPLDPRFFLNASVKQYVPRSTGKWQEVTALP